MSGTKPDMAMPVVVRGLYTIWADFVYQPKNGNDLADSARSAAFSGQLRLLAEASDLATHPEAKDAILSEYCHFVALRRNDTTVDLPTQRTSAGVNVEANIFGALLKARRKLRACNAFFPPDEVEREQSEEGEERGSGIAHRVHPRPNSTVRLADETVDEEAEQQQQSPSRKRKRRDSAVGDVEEPPRRRRAKTMWCPYGADPAKLWKEKVARLGRYY